MAFSLRELLHIDSHRLFSRFINYAWEEFKDTAYKGWGATYTDGTVVRLDKTDNDLERVCIGLGQEIGDRLYDMVKEKAGSIENIGISEFKYSWNGCSSMGNELEDNDIEEIDLWEGVDKNK
jgi:hypothetical protein